MHRLNITSYHQAKPLFQAMDQHLAVRAILEGSSPGTVLVDSLDRPRAALAWSSHRFYLAGSSPDRVFAQAVGQLFSGEIYPQSSDAGAEMLVLYYAPDGWQDQIDLLLPAKLPIPAPRQFYALKKLKHDWRDLLPDGFSLAPVDQALLARRHLGNLDALGDELCSERASVEDFLLNSFGVCAIHGDELAGWCLSEYNSGDRCEVGIETLPPFRQRGLATAMASALIEHALAQGIDRIGWHCYASNESSVATALKVGFTNEVDYPVYMAWFDDTINLAVHGNVAFRRGDYDQALPWYERAMASGQAPDWACWNAACAAARLGLHDSALSYLDDAVDRGFRDLDRLRESEHLAGLHGKPGWAALVARLEED